MNSPRELILALEDIDKSLEGQRIEIVLVGSMAIFFHGHTLTRETDIDFCRSSSTEKIIELSKIVSHKYELDEEWINNRSSDLSPLPDGFLDRLIKVEGFANLQVFIPSERDLITLKVYAFYMRRSMKDMEDLTTLSPKRDNICEGIKYIKDQILFHHGVVTLKDNMDEIESFKNLLLERFDE